MASDRAEAGGGTTGFGCERRSDPIWRRRRAGAGVVPAAAEGALTVDLAEESSGALGGAAVFMRGLGTDWEPAAR
ncbi:MAG TPA: hypothetical protein VGP90_15055, partial [Acidimicrobiia bacterium]|nr:hypothetical protein [Acidimicrobiia bacterium]